MKAKDENSKKFRIPWGTVWLVLTALIATAMAFARMQTELATYRKEMTGRTAAVESKLDITTELVIRHDECIRRIKETLPEISKTLNEIRVSTGKIETKVQIIDQDVKELKNNSRK